MTAGQAKWIKGDSLNLPNCQNDSAVPDKVNLLSILFKCIYEFFRRGTGFDYQDPVALLG
jgi:hypothetical protein